MTKILCDAIYYNTQVYFRKHFIDDLPNDDKEWAKAYHAWLKEQGATVVPPPNKQNLLATALGVSPYYDHFCFENDHDATVFVLKWS